MSERLQKAEGHVRAARGEYDRQAGASRVLWHSLKFAMQRALEARLELEVAQQNLADAKAREGETFVIVTGITNSNELEALRKDLEWARRFVGP